MQSFPTGYKDWSPKQTFPTKVPSFLLEGE